MKLGEIKTRNYSILSRNLVFLLEILLIFSILIGINFISSNIQNFNEKSSHIHPKISKISGKIYINNNWSAVKSVGICTGSGTTSDPYVIEDLIIDGGNSGSCIFIENSDVYFKIENCTLINAGSVLGDSGIRLYNVDNGVLINNTASNNDYFGILLHWSNNIDVLQNKLNFNNGEGLHVLYSTNNLLSGNSISNNGWNGIRLRFSDKNDIINNLVRAHSIGIYIDEYSDKNIIEDNSLNINSIGIRIVSQSSCNQILSNFYNGNGQDVQNYQNPQADCSEPINLIPIIIGVVIALIVGISIPVVFKIRRRSSKDELEKRKYIKDVLEITEEFRKPITPISEVKGEKPEVEALAEISLEEEPITPVLEEKVEEPGVEAPNEMPLEEEPIIPVLEEKVEEPGVEAPNEMPLEEEPIIPVLEEKVEELKGEKLIEIPLDEEHPPPTSEEIIEVIKVASIFCKFCGMELNKKARFCPQCGTRIKKS